MNHALHEPRAAASLPRRAVAALLDGLVLGLALQALHWSAVVIARPAFDSGWAWHAYLLASVSLPAWCYFALSEGSARQATLGKRWLGLRVVDEYGGRVGLGRALARTAVKLLPWELAHIALCYPEPVFVTGELPMPRVLVAVYALVGLYGAVAMLSLKKQSVHDWAASTCVVRNAPQADARAAAG